MGSIINVDFLENEMVGFDENVDGSFVIWHATMCDVAIIGLPEDFMQQH